MSATGEERLMPYQMNEEPSTIAHDSASTSQPRRAMAVLHHEIAGLVGPVPCDPRTVKP
jgi:hypothetical protein